MSVSKEVREEYPLYKGHATPLIAPFLERYRELIADRVASAEEEVAAGIRLTTLDEVVAPANE